MKSILLIPLVATTVAAVSLEAQTTIVMWGPAEDIVSSSQNLTVGKNATSVNLSTKTSPDQGADYYPNDTGATPEFYAAIIAQEDGIDNNINNWRVQPATPDDYIFANNNAAEGFTGTNNVFSILLWQKSSFLAGGDTIDVELNGMSVSVDGNAGTAFGRFVIQLDNASFYVSQQYEQVGNTFNTFSFTDPSAVTWYNYDPVNSDFRTIGSEAAITDFSNVTTAGAFVQNNVDGRFAQLWVRDFQMVGTIPEPAAYAFLFGATVAIGTLVRRRR